MAYFRQRRVRAGMMCSAVAVRQLISTFSSLQINLGLATHPHRHHCLAALRADKAAQRFK
jgi:hypothetical protein